MAHPSSGLQAGHTWASSPDVPSIAVSKMLLTRHATLWRSDMQHTIPISKLEKSLGPYAASMAHTVESCVHCGFCLSVCPTYQVLGEEMDSPRGRIVLRKSSRENEVTR